MIASLVSLGSDDEHLSSNSALPVFLEDERFKLLGLMISSSALAAALAGDSRLIVDASVTHFIRFFSLVRSLALSLAFVLDSLSGIACALANFLGGFGLAGVFLALAAGFFPSA
jgi:small-conductance mechanosensitive channel